MINCPKCQTQNPDAGKFCIGCGNPMPKKGLPKILLAIIGLILLILGGAQIIRGISELTKPSSSNSPQVVLSPASTITPNQNVTSTVQNPTGKYALDSNNDGIPDFMETAIGYNPNKDECLLNSCPGFDPTKSGTVLTNILFILDSSGSMAEMSGSQVKMVAAKAALKNYLKLVSENTSIGLMIYGHKGSNSQGDKALSCVGIDLLYPIGRVDINSFNTAIDSFQPTGWTAIGGSLRKALTVFASHEGQNNRVVIITDGIETCDSDPVSAAKDLQLAGVKPVIDVIGLSLDATAKSQLQQVAQVGGGTYYDAQTADQFNDVLLNWQKNVVENVESWRCRAVNITTYINCVNERQIKVQAYLSNLSLSFSQNKQAVNGVTAGLDDNPESINRVRENMKTYHDQAYEKYRQTLQKTNQDYQNNYNKTGLPLQK